jgi:hypothetical protein
MFNPPAFQNSINYTRIFQRPSAAIHPATSVKQVKPGDDVGGIAPPWFSELFKGE